MRSRPAVRVLWLGALIVLGASACSGSGAADPADQASVPSVPDPSSVTSDPIAQLDLPPSGADSVGDDPAAVLDLDAVDVCDLLDFAAVRRLAAVDAGGALDAERASASVAPFGTVRTCRVSFSGRSRGVSLAVTRSGPAVDELLGLQLVTDAILGFDREPVDLGDEAIAQIARSSTQGVSRLCIGVGRGQALLLLCIEDADHDFTFDDPEVAGLTALGAEVLDRL